MQNFHPAAGRLLVALACSFFLSSLASAQGAPGDVNSTNAGQVVQGGTYFNTPGSKTAFTNSGSGLWIKSGTTVRGLEVSDPAHATTSTTGNGGWLHFSAPGQVVRIDGDVNVSAIIKGGTLGNGGKVTVDSAYLFQSGHIFANGKNAGMVQLNVGSMTMAPGASVEAKGSGGNGGQVGIHATGAVDLATNSSINTSGVSNLNSNVIAVEGGLVNANGLLIANGVSASANGGKISLVSNGNATALDATAVNHATGMFTSAEADQLLANDNSLRRDLNGDVHLGVNSALNANGANGASSATPGNGGGGGVVMLAARNSIMNEGFIGLNGGNGGNNTGTVIGPVVTDANGKTSQVSQGLPGGNGGNGGLLTCNFGKSLELNGSIKAKGGAGGKGGNATALASTDHTIAFGGAGGNGGNGGTVSITGPAPLPSEFPSINLAGGPGGPGGLATYLMCYDKIYTYGPGGSPGSPGGVVTYPVIPTPTGGGGGGTPGGGGGGGGIVVPPVIPGLFQEERPKPVGYVAPVPALLAYGPEIFPHVPTLVATVPKPSPLYTQIFIPAPQPVVTVPKIERRAAVRGYW